MDKLTPEQRSFNMSRISGKNTSLELSIRRIVHAMGYRYRLHDRSLPGCPDMVLPRHSKLIQIHGCYWHPHLRCPIAHLPKSRIDYWGPKLEGNRLRDSRNTKTLRGLGWQVLVIRECKARHRTRLIESLRSFLES